MIFCFFPGKSFADNLFTFKSTASLSGTNYVSKPTSGSVFGIGAATTSLGFSVEPASPQPAAGSIFGKGAGQMREMGSAFGRTNSDDVQTASGNRI